MAHWTPSTHRQRGRVPKAEAKADGRQARRQADRALVDEGVEELDQLLELSGEPSGRS